MNISINLKGNYHEIIGKSKQLLGKISNKKALEFEGNVERMAGHIQKKYQIDYAAAMSSAKKIIANAKLDSQYAI